MSDPSKKVNLRGRVVRSRGPIIISLEIAELIALGLAIVALFVAYFSIHQSRRNAAVDSCRLFRGLVIAATPPSQLAKAVAFIHITQLSNCEIYARRLVK